MMKTLQHTAEQCNSLQNAHNLQWLGSPWHSWWKHVNTLQHAATRWNTLQHTQPSMTMWLLTLLIMHTLQHTATCCNTLQQATFIGKAVVGTHDANTATRCKTLPNAATHCNTMHIAATRCNLQWLSGPWHSWWEQSKCRIITESDSRRKIPPYPLWV